MSLHNTCYRTLDKRSGPALLAILLAATTYAKSQTLPNPPSSPQPATTDRYGNPSATESSNPSQTHSPIHFADQEAGTSGTQGSASPSQPGDLLLNAKDVDQNIWANAKTYVDLPTAEVVAAVPELQGLEPEASQEELSSLLGRIGQSSMELVHRTPNVASREDQDTNQRIVSRVWQGVMAPYTPPPAHDHQEFQYLLLSRQTETGREFHEYRTDKQGRPVANPRSRLGQTTQGFVSEWLRLIPGNQPESRFRYLGRQDIQNRKTLVVAFAQIPEKAKFPPQFVFEGLVLTVLMQGIVWVDATDFRIVRMREDLLAPRPDVYLKQLTTTIQFGDVSIQKAGTTLWLPREAVIAWEYKGMAAEQRHVYSDFRLYEVKTKIITE